MTELDRISDSTVAGVAGVGNQQLQQSNVAGADLLHSPNRGKRSNPTAMQRSGNETLSPSSSQRPKPIRIAPAPAAGVTKLAAASNAVQSTSTLHASIMEAAQK